MDTLKPLVEKKPEERSQFQRYSDEAAKIQGRCACIRWEARECIQARYRAPMDDLERHSETWQDFLDDTCECRCHDELGELEEDIWGPRDDDY